MKSHHSKPEATEIVEKILLLGDISVGKTSLITRFTNNDFFTNLGNTIGRPNFFKISLILISIGVEYHRKSLTLEGKEIELEIWDTSGQERYQSIAKSFYRGCMGIVIVFDVTSDKSFGNVKSWIEHLQQDADSEVIKILVGNKADLKKEVHAVDQAQIDDLANEWNLKYFETSAKTGENVKEAFEWIALKIYEKLTGFERKDSRISLSKKDVKAREGDSKSQGCCN